MSELQARPNWVAIVGVGNVGATFAYALLLSGLAAEIVLIDMNRAKAEGEAMDLSPEEIEAVRKSAEVLKATVKQLKLEVI